MTITATKRKLISRDAAKYDGVITFASLMAISNSYMIPHGDVRKLLAAMGYKIDPAPEPQQAGQASTKKPSAPTPAPLDIPKETVAAILSGSLFRILDPDPETDPKRVFVVTTLDKFRREREAIRRILQGLSADLPPEDGQDSPDPG